MNAIVVRCILTRIRIVKIPVSVQRLTMTGKISVLLPKLTQHNIMIVTHKGIAKIAAIDANALPAFIGASR